MKKVTAVEWLEQKLNRIGLNSDLIGHLTTEAKQIEIQQSHEYAEFAIRCDRMGMKILNFDGFIKLEK
jgi:hypothetical protein